MYVVAGMDVCYVCLRMHVHMSICACASRRACSHVCK